jgi:predicted TIM-barrel fold metal-dependent hydrolase
MFDSVIDCDVHHLPRREAEILEYLPERFRDIADLYPSGRIYRPAQMIGHPDGVNSRLDAIPADGSPAGSDYELMREQLLDPYRVSVALLNWGSKGAIAHGEFAPALCAAENRWCAERWLGDLHDDRLYAAIAVAMHDPAEAAREIRACGANPHFAAVLLTYHPFGRPIGHPVYLPIYEAASELGLPLYIHVNLGEHNGATGPQISGGIHPSYRFDFFVTVHHTIAVHITSLIFNGMFERLPSLKLLVAESGLAWLPGFAAALDSSYELMRRESRWVRKWPSEYLREHVRVGTQPCEASRISDHELVDQLRTLEGIEDMLCFSSDYPHWDNDVSSFIEAVFPADWHAQIFRDNALRILRLPAGV